MKGFPDRIVGKHLDGEATPAEEAELRGMRNGDPDLDREVRALEDEKRILGKAGTPEPPGDLAASIMERVRAEPPAGRLKVFLLRPRTLRIRIATGLAAAAALAMAALILWRLESAESDAPRPAVPAKGGAVAEQGTDRVEAPEKAAAAGDGAAGQPQPPEPAVEDRKALSFRIAVNGAHDVRLVGDFNGWAEDGLALADEDHDGVWTLDIDLHPGRYQYMVLVDGKSRIDDPGADALVEDGFGGKNSVRHLL